MEQSFQTQLWFQHIDCTIHRYSCQVISSVNFKAKWNETPPFHTYIHILPIDFCANRLQKGKTPARFMLNRKGFKCTNHNQNNKRINRRREKEKTRNANIISKFIEFDGEKSPSSVSTIAIAMCFHLIYLHLTCTDFTDTSKCQRKIMPLQLFNNSLDLSFSQ